MSAVLTPILPEAKPAVPYPTTPSSAGTGWQRRLFTRDEFWRLYEIGFFGRERIRLVGGEIIEMAPQGNLHGLAIYRVCVALEQAFGPSFWVRNQLTLDLGPLSLADPDIAVVPGNPLSYMSQNTNPTTSLLVVEVDHSALSEDRNEMASLYASAGIADYWIVNVRDEQLEVRCDPQADAAQRFGHGYASLVTLRRGDFVTPLAAPAAQVAVADLLPTLPHPVNTAR